MGFPSINQVHIVGKLAMEPKIKVVNGRRFTIFGVLTRDDEIDRIHRIVVKDEFLIKAIYDDLKVGVIIQIVGQLDIDDDGVMVSVPSKRGSDVQVFLFPSENSVDKKNPNDLNSDDSHSSNKLKENNVVNTEIVDENRNLSSERKEVDKPSSGFHSVNSDKSDGNVTVQTRTDGRNGSSGQATGGSSSPSGSASPNHPSGFGATRANVSSGSVHPNSPSGFGSSRGSSGGFGKLSQKVDEQKDSAVVGENSKSGHEYASGNRFGNNFSKRPPVAIGPDEIDDEIPF